MTKTVTSMRVPKLRAWFQNKKVNRRNLALAGAAVAGAAAAAAVPVVKLSYLTESLRMLRCEKLQDHRIGSLGEFCI